MFDPSSPTRANGCAGGMTGLGIEPVAFDRHAAQFDLLVTLQETGDGVLGTAEYSADLFERATVERMMADYLEVLEAAAEAPGRPLSALAPAPAPARPASATERLLAGLWAELLGVER